MHQAGHSPVPRHQVHVSACIARPLPPEVCVEQAGGSRVVAPGQGCGSAPQTPECSPHLWVLWVQEGLQVQDTASRGISIPEGGPL